MQQAILSRCLDQPAFRAFMDRLVGTLDEISGDQTVLPWRLRALASVLGDIDTFPAVMVSQEELEEPPSAFVMAADRCLKLARKMLSGGSVTLVRPGQALFLQFRHVVRPFQLVFEYLLEASRDPELVGDSLALFLLERFPSLSVRDSLCFLIVLSVSVVELGCVCRQGLFPPRIREGAVGRGARALLCLALSLPAWRVSSQARIPGHDRAPEVRPIVGGRVLGRLRRCDFDDPGD